MTAKVKGHYKNLKRPLRIEGLWNWRRVADCLLQAGISMQSGTVPVERTWSFLLSVFPEQSRSMSLPWFKLLSDLAFLRVTYVHFNRSSLPPWAEKDSLLGERIEELFTCAQTTEQDEDSNILAVLAREFERAVPLP